MAPLKNNYFEIALFSLKLFRTLKTALRKQRCLCQKFPLSIPINTWKISWFERLIFFCHTNRSRLATFVTEIVFMSFCFCRLAVRHSKKNCIHSPVRLDRSKNIACVYPFEKNCICSPVRLYRSKKCCIRSAVQPTFRMACLAVCYPFTCRAFGRSNG